MEKSNKKSLILLSAILLITIVGIAFSIIAILALNKVSTNSGVTIKYIAIDVDGSVSATLKVGESGTEDPMLTETNNSLIVFKASDSSSPTETLYPSKEIVLTATNNFIVITYSFESTGDADYTAELTYEDTDETDSNIKFLYKISESDEFTTNKPIVTVKQGTTSKFYLKVEVENTDLDAVLSGNFIWNLNSCDETGFIVSEKEDGTYTAAYNGIAIQNGELNIPNEINGITITEVVANPNLTEEEKLSITSVIIGDGITTISDSAFEGFSNLQTVTFLYGQTALTRNITTIGNSAFKGTAITSLVIPSTITSVGSYAFAGCANLKSITVSTDIILPYSEGMLPASLEEIRVLSSKLETYQNADGWKDFADIINGYRPSPPPV